MNRIIKVACDGVADDYRQSLIPLMIKSLGHSIQWTSERQADLLIIGPFQKPLSKKLGWVPKPLRPVFTSIRQHSSEARINRPLTLFHTAENLRHNHVSCDYSISFDLCVNSLKHLRVPYWMEMLDWTHEGVVGNSNPRFGQLLKIPQLMQPLGSDFLSRPFQAAMFTSHLREPRQTLTNTLRKLMPVKGYGPYYDNKIRHHSSSNISKANILQEYAFNLCPENTLYPGYYTEKIPEAFAAGCLPITWADNNISVDFNPKAFINLAPEMHNGFENILQKICDRTFLLQTAEEQLILERPSLDPLKAILRDLLQDALS